MKKAVNNKPTWMLQQYVMILFVIITTSVFSQELDKSVDLSGKWKFMIGDDMRWKNIDYDDDHWEEIHVPRAWEEQGFHGYDGYAWYRKTFIIPSFSEKISYYLDLGFIDDVDQVFVNGQLIGKSGYFPPNYSTAYKAHRLYIIPHKILHKTNKVTVAVRVYDEGGEGGIIHGNIGLWLDKESLYTDLDLQGEWKFKTGNCSNIEDVALNYSSWDEILVPGMWEEQGYKDYDGIACYAKEFELKGQFENDRMILLLGRIDDLDMVYVNGILIGQSSDFEVSTAEQRNDMYKQMRGYYVPENVLIHRGKNLITVRVLDWWGMGGIWDGAVGLITQDNYIYYWRKKRNSVR